MYVKRRSQKKIVKYVIYSWVPNPKPNPNAKKNRRREDKAMNNDELLDKISILESKLEVCTNNQIRLLDKISILESKIEICSNNESKLLDKISELKKRNKTKLYDYVISAAYMYMPLWIMILLLLKN